MGNTNQKLEDYDVVRSFHPEQWQNKETHGSYEIWENSSKNLRSDVYPINTEIKQTDLDRYEIRHNANDDVVKVHHLRIQNEPSLCSKSSSAQVFVERIPYRLPELTELSHSESLSVLRSAYSGFDQISKFYGQVEPYEDMICFNEEGKCKVWINSSLAENEVEKNRQGKDFRKNQSSEANINKIFDMVENRTIGRSLPEGLKNSFRNKSPKNYYEAINILEEYAGENRVNIPRTINNRVLSNSMQKVGEQSSQIESINQFHNHPHQINDAQHISTLPQNVDIHSQSLTHTYNPNQLSKQNSEIIRQPSQSVFTVPVTSGVRGTPMLRTEINQRNQGSQYFIRSNGNSMFSVMPNQINREHHQFHTEGQVEMKRIHSPLNLPISAQKDQFNRPIEPQSPSPSLRFNSPFKNPPVKDAQIHLQHSPIILKNTQNFQIPIHPLNVQEVGKVGHIGEAGLRYPPVNQQGMWGNQVQYVHPLSIHPHLQKQEIQRQPQSQPQIILQNLVPFQVQTQGNVQSPTPVKNLPHLQFEQAHSEIALNSQLHQQEKKEIEIQPEQSKELLNLGAENEQIAVVKQSEEKNDKESEEREEREELREDINERQNLSVENEHGFREARSEENSNQEEGQEEEERRLESENDEENINEERESQTKYEHEEEQQQREFDESEIERENHETRNKSGIDEHSQGRINSVQFGILNNGGNNHIEYVENDDHSRNLQEVEETGQQKYQPEAKIKRISTVEVHVPEEKLVEDGEQHEELNERGSSDEQSVQSGEAISEKNVKEERNKGYNYEYKSSTEKVNSGENRIPDNAGYEDIEQYIRNKYKKYLNTNPTNVNVDEMSSYVESKYDQYTNSNANQNTQFSFRPTREEERRKSKHVTIEKEYLRGDSQRSERDVGYNNDYVDERQFGVSHEDAYREEYQNDKTIEKVSERGTEKGLEEEGDILDVRFLEKSLDKKYSSLKSNKQIKNITNENEEDHGFSVKKLEENLMRFEESKVSQNQQFNFNSSNPIFETSQVSKINSIDHLLAQRRSSMKKEESYYNDTGPNINYENKLPAETYQKRNSARTANITRELSSIDEKFNKYVTKQASSNTVLKPKEQNYEEVYDASSRMATGHFGYPEEKGRSAKHHQDHDDYEGKFFATSEVRSHKGGISYEELRKYMWS